MVEIKKRAWVAACLEDGTKDIELTEFSIEDADGSLLSHLVFRSGTGEIEHLWTEPSMRRMGFARALWAAARADGVCHSSWRTDDGDAFAQAVGGHLPRRQRP